MSRKHGKNCVQDQLDADEEARLDLEYKNKVVGEVNQQIEEDTELKYTIFIYSDMKTYLDSNGVTNLFKNLSVDFIKDNF